ncbi:MAG: DinB family protein [Bryobacteraceae bacterium]|jgi:hypothetical protein
MRLLTGILLISASLMPLSGEPISQGDREYALSALHASRKMFLDSVAGLSESQLNFKPAADKWSIAEVAEHIALSEGFIFQAVQGALQTPAREKMTDARKLDEKILAAVPDRTVKRTAPEPLQPHHQYKSVAEAVAAFKSARDSHIAYIGATQDPLREHFSKHPALGELDAYQWILLMSAHTERHVNQILEVKASPGFPQQ